MSARPLEWLRDLQSATLARQLYPDGHPCLLTLMDRLAAGAADLTVAQPEWSAFAVDGRVAADGEVVDDGEALARGLFATLRAQGYHRLSVRRGVSRGEIESFVAQLARVYGRGAAPGLLQPTEHIRLAAVEEVQPEHGLTVMDVFADCHAKLPPLWRGICDERRLDGQTLESIALGLLRLMHTQPHAIVPLAALRSHDDYTVTHVANVAMLAMALSEVLGLGQELTQAVGVAALLHDIGKLDVPADVLNAKGKLTDRKLLQIRRHPEEGARILAETPGATPLSMIVAYEHHIRFDGGGYPTVQRGWKQNLASTITQISDVYDALRSNRPYREGMPPDVIASHMKRDAGTAFHPELVRVFFDRVVPRAADLA